MTKGTFSAPAERENDVRQLISRAVVMLGRGDKKFKLPQTSNVVVEWVGHWPRSSTSNTDPQPAISEQEKFVILMRDPKTDTTIVYLFGGAFLYEQPISLPAWSPSHALLIMLNPPSRNCPATVRSIVSNLVESIGARCLTIGYRLAPQNPFLAALLDVLISYLSLLHPPADS